MNKAVFLDRDGVINELVYHIEQEVIDSPFTPDQLKLMPGVVESIRLLHQAGYLAVLVSNQPGVAKGHMTIDTFNNIQRRLQDELAAAGARLDAEFYCLHHPHAILENYRVNCTCRKPAPGLILEAARDMGIDLSRSWMIGDNLSDIKAGQSAGCRTVLLGNHKCETCRLMEEQNTRPDQIFPGLLEAVKYITLSSSPLTGEVR
jgi:D-glycero-D-manno-heptose 1,7-bisphosphate phosphatase